MGRENMNFEEWVKQGCPWLPNKRLAFVVIIICLIIGMIIGGVYI
jgi:hypothetical protein